MIDRDGQAVMALHHNTKRVAKDVAQQAREHAGCHTPAGNLYSCHINNTTCIMLPNQRRLARSSSLEIMQVEANMIELNEQQQRLLDAADAPARVVDPRNHETYFLVPASAFEKMKTLLELNGRWSEDAFRASMEAFGQAGWNDPAMDVYDALDPRRQT